MQAQQRRKSKEQPISKFGVVTLSFGAMVLFRWIASKSIAMTLSFEAMAPFLPMPSIQPREVALILDAIALTTEEVASRYWFWAPWH